MNHPAKLRLLASGSFMGGGDWLQPICGDWPSAACRALELETAVVRVVVAAIKGSAPREPGTCMLVGAGSVVGTIGGGHLEWQAIQSARKLLISDASTSAVRTERLVLGTQLGQCCGGVVELWVEQLTRRDLPLLRSAAQAARDAEPVLMATTLAARRVTRRVMRAATPAFLPPGLRSSAESLLALDAQGRICLTHALGGSDAEPGLPEHIALALRRRACGAGTGTRAFGAARQRDLGRLACGISPPFIAG